MAIYNLENYQEKDGLGFPLNFRRGNPNPLDNSSVQLSLTAAQNYAKTDPTAYVGQILSVINKAADGALSVDVYKIVNEAGDLEKVGTSLVGDMNTITVTESGTVKLVGIEGLVLTREVEQDGETITQDITYQPLLVKGKLTWVEPSSTTVEGLDAAIKALEKQVSDAQQDIKNLQDKDTELAQQIAAAKQEAIDEAKLQILGENVHADFDTLKEVADWIASDTTNSTQLINRVSAIEQDYLKGADKTEIQGKVDELKQFVGTLPEGAASTNVIAYIQEVIAALNIGEYAKASELTSLANRVKKLEDFLTDEMIAKLNGFEAGAQVNKIDGVSDEFVISEDGKVLSVKEISQDKVTGLEEALRGKVSAVEGKGLSSNDLTDELLEKLNSIASGAEANYVKSVTDELEVSEEGELSVKKVDLSKVVQAEGHVLILNGGSAKI